ncbi:MAG TPA: MFS transporter [Alphaproteobacteria bacterium]|jgi:MFS family permease
MANRSYGGIGRALAERNFRIFTIGSSLALVGMWIQRIGVGWLAWQLTKSPAWLGMIAFADLFPTVIFTPIAGAIADRMDRLKIMKITQMLAMIQSIVLATLTMLDWIDIWAMFGLSLFLGIVLSFNVAARLAMTASMISKENLAAAIALSSGIFNLARFLGPAVGGFIIVHWGVGVAFAVNSVSFLSMLIGLYMMHDLFYEELASRKANIFRQTYEGFAYAFRHPGIGPTLLALNAVGFGLKPFIDMLPGVSDLIYQMGAHGLSMLASATGLGALVSALWLAQRGTVRNVSFFSLLSLLIGGASLMLLAATDIFFIGLACAFVCGAAMTVNGTGTQTLMQNSVESSMRGRVMSLYGVIFRGTPALGALCMGTASEIIGLPAVFVCGGALSVAAFAWMWRRRGIVAASLEKEPD